MSTEQLKEVLKEELTKNTLKVTFTKKDGSERVMVCTLKESELPEKPASTRDKKPNPNVIAVWDTEAKGFRSFRLDSVISVEII